MPRRNHPRRRPLPVINDWQTVYQPTTDELARRLVRTGKASPRILGPLTRAWKP